MANVETFREGLRQIGYVEGQNFAVEYRSGERATQLAELAAELVRQKVDLIVTAGPGVAASMKATETIPIVSVSVVIRLKLVLLTALHGREEA